MSLDYGNIDLAHGFDDVLFRPPKNKVTEPEEENQEDNQTLGVPGPSRAQKRKQSSEDHGEDSDSTVGFYCAALLLQFLISILFSPALKCS